MSRLFVPDNFEVPVEVRVGQYVLRPLSEVYAEIDLAAVNSSLELIRETRGGSWPAREVSFAEDEGDLREHRNLFEHRSAFAYSVLSEDEKTCAGSVYINPPHHPFDDTDQSSIPADADAAVSFWVSQRAYDKGFYPVLQRFVEQWLRQSWPFQKPFIVNKLKI